MEYMSPDEEDPLGPCFQEFYHQQRRCNKYISKLRKFVAEHYEHVGKTKGAPTCDEEYKVEHVNALIEFHKRTDLMLKTRVHQLEQSEAQREVEEIEALLRECTETCKVMSESFKAALGRPACIFRYAWERTRSYIESHPKTTLGIVGGCTTLGGCAGAGFFSLLNLKVGFHAWCGAVAGSAAVPLGAAIGAAVGLLIFGLWAAVDVCTSGKPVLAQEAVDQRKEIERIIKQIEVTPLNAEDISRLRNTFAECLGEPVVTASMAVGSECSICRGDDQRAAGRWEAAACTALHRGAFPPR